MTPDRVIGLHMTDGYKKQVGQYPRYLDHCPVLETKIIHPFLVIEAKREFQAPGFRGIEAQTAFVLRRLLNSQVSVRIQSRVNLSPLIWFFAFRGDIWRLYVGILQEDEVLRMPRSTNHEHVLKLIARLRPLAGNDRIRRHCAAIVPDS